MATEETGEKKEKKGKGKLIIIILLVLVLISTLVLGYFFVTGTKIADIKESFTSHEEYTVLLDEFIVNLSSENSAKNYLKVEVALMYTEKKKGETINVNVNKIRDIVINNIRSKTSSEISGGENTTTMKKQMIQVRIGR